MRSVARNAVHALLLAVSALTALTKPRVGPIVAASLAAGFVVAALLVVGPFAGAPEHAITGVTLLAFASSWGVLAGLTIRSTDQPQRWAIAPAATLGLVGAGLLVFAPSGGAMDALGWVWPPALFALSVWIFAGARRVSRFPGRNCTRVSSNRGAIWLPRRGCAKVAGQPVN